MVFPSLQWNEFHLKAWSWLKDGSFQGHVQFEVDCDLMWYENKVETIERIHSLNFLGENSPKAVKIPSQKDHLSTDA